MKRKIDTIKGKRLVMGGGTNLLTKDEILVTETPNGVELKERSSDGSIKEIASGGGGGDSEVKIWYYKDVSDNLEILYLFPMVGVKTLLFKYRDNSGVGEGIIGNVNLNNGSGSEFYKQYFKLSTLDTCNGMNLATSSILPYKSLDGLK